MTDICRRIRAVNHAARSVDRGVPDQPELCFGTQANRAASGGFRSRPPVIEAQAWSVQTSDPGASQYARDDRVFHQKFGYGRVRYVEGNKLTVEFDKAGEKRVIDQFVQRA